MKNNVIALIIGIIIFMLGAYQNTQYEEHSLKIDAVITDIETKDRTDDGPVSYKHTYYGDYTVDGVEYTNKKLTSKYTSSSLPDLSPGDTLEITVSPENPSKKTAEGSIFLVIGFIVTLYNAFALIKRKRAKS